MATYDDWNEALFNYTIAGVPRGARVYIAIDDEVLAWIAPTLSTTPEDFLSALQLKCVQNGVINLKRIFAFSATRANEPIPRYFSFLSSMVLAAHRMGEREDLDRKVFFSYFNEIIGVEKKDEGRPHGLEHGAEEQLWKAWNKWLQANGFQPTASETIEGRPFSYALSQALLRSVDKNALWRHFSLVTGKYPDHLAKGELLRQLRADMRLSTSSFPKHLEKLLHDEGNPGSQRYDDLSGALHESFAAWVAVGRPEERSKKHQDIGPIALRAGLYRAEDHILREVHYYLLPRQPRYIQAFRAHVIDGEYRYELRPDRPGWFAPLPRALDPQGMCEGVTLSVQGAGNIDQLVLEAADFWVLSPDPEDVNSGIYASWDEHPEVGVPFVLMCREMLQTDMQQLSQDGLISWEDENPFDGWTEYCGVKVLKDVWPQPKVMHQELVNQLRPRSHIGVVLTGGLRDARSGAWLIGCEPKIIVNAFAGDVHIQLKDLETEQVVSALTQVQAGSLVALDWPRASGDYSLHVTSEDQERTRVVQIVDWSALDASELDTRAVLRLGKSSILGAWVEVD